MPKPRNSQREKCYYTYSTDNVCGIYRFRGRRFPVSLAKQSKSEGGDLSSTWKSVLVLAGPHTLRRDKGGVTNFVDSSHSNQRVVRSQPAATTGRKTFSDQT